MKSLVLTTVEALALATDITFAATTAPHTSNTYVVLWDQNTNFGGGVNSQDYESAMWEYDDQAADDFVVPNHRKWFISEVDVTGAYTGGSGPASSVVVSFMRTRNGRPGGTAQGGRDYFTLNCTDNAGSFQCVLPTNRHNKPVVKLGPGTWWVSVVANCDSQTCGTWNWTEKTTVAGYQAVWQNPGAAWKIGCHSWSPLNTCFGGSPADLAFKLIGASKTIFRDAACAQIARAYGLSNSI